MTSPLVRLKSDTTLRDALRDGDPMSHEDGMRDADASAIKRVMLAQSADTPRRPLLWNAALAAIPTCAVLVLGSTLHDAVPTQTHHQAARVPAASDLSRARQLYFQTVGGTRVIWIFTVEEEEQ